MHSVQHTNLALLTTAELVEQLEAMAPGARALLDRLGAGYRGRARSGPGRPGRCRASRPAPVRSSAGN